MNSTLKHDICCWPKVLCFLFMSTQIAWGAGEKAQTTAPPDIAKLEALAQKETENIALRSQLGRIYLRDKNYEKAIYHLKEAAAVEPNPTNLTALADAYRKNKNYLDEIRTLEVLAQRLPQDAAIQELLGRAYFTTSNYDKAGPYYRKAITLDKKRLGAYEGLYEVFTKANNNYERRALLTDMQSVFGDTPAVATKLCRFFSQDNYIEKSIEVCLKAVTLDPNIPDNHMFLALSYKSSKEIDQSLKIIQSAAKRFTKSELAQYTAGVMNDDIKNYESSRYYYRRCVKLDAKSDRCWVALGQAALQLRDYQESLDAFTTACKLNPRANYVTFRNATTTVRIQRQTPWENKFQNAVDGCGISGP